MKRVRPNKKALEKFEKTFDEPTKDMKREDAKFKKLQDRLKSLVKPKRVKK